MTGRSSIAKATAAFVLLWLYVSGCSLNPQPEPPGTDVGEGGSAPTQGGTGGASGSSNSGGAETSGGNSGTAGGVDLVGGSSGEGGAAGEAGMGGTAGSAGSGGSSGKAGEAGSAGDGGAGGTSGEGGEGGSGGSGGGMLSECQEYAISLCQKLNACEPFAFKLTYGDLIACAARENVVCVLKSNAEDSGLVQGQALACMKVLNEASCETFLTGTLGGACAPVVGARELDASCGDHSQCQSTFCKRAGNCGICAPVPVDGDTCASNNDCALGHACTDAGACAPYALLDEGCSSARCAPTLSCRAGTCQAPLPLGAPCTANEDCNVLSGATCLENVCTQTLLVHEGGSCGSATTPTTCDVSSSCVVEGEQGICKRKVADDEACTEDGPSCLAGARCYNGVCLLEDPMLCK